MPRMLHTERSDRRGAGVDRLTEQYTNLTFLMLQHARDTMETAKRLLEVAWTRLDPLSPARLGRRNPPWGIAAICDVADPVPGRAAQ
jgi:hypothetical protein